MKVFLGGTRNSTWRDELIPKLKIDYFNPVVPYYTEGWDKIELQEKETCDIVLYTLTPLMTGVYEVAEVVDDSNKRPEKTIFCIKRKDAYVEFDYRQEMSIMRVGKMVGKNGALVVPFEALEYVLNDYQNARVKLVQWLNNLITKKNEV